MEPTTLTTGRLLLRPFAPADAPEVHAACQDPGIQRWTLVPSPYERAHAEAWTGELSARGWREDTEYAFAVRLRAPADPPAGSPDAPPDGAPAGSRDGAPGGSPGGPLVASVGVHVRGPDGYEIGYWAAPSHRGRGYTTEAVLAVARWLFTDVGAGRLEWRAAVGNAASRAVAEKAGFRIEGTLRAGMEHRGALRDCWVGALLPGDLGLPSRLPYEPAVSATP